ncbi:SGNH/GDSL hydrolase family protein [Burkholderia cenocepacia]|uniref:hypothetical protein n=1 Tax=Burkholderia cenocepacia TaxID=95486 RepID=UPI002AB7AA88|nr:hypothetical protein [Burkholderia cenocepacia]
MRNNDRGTDKPALVIYAVRRFQHQGHTMCSAEPTTPQQICENILIEGKRYNIEHDILPSENAVADRLLSRGLELKAAYAELHEKLHQHSFALKAFLDLLLSTAAFWNLDKISEARSARSDLTNVNQQIADKAAELAELLAQRSELHNTSGFSSNTHYHVCGVIEAASKNNYLFNSHVKKRLAALSGQFDLKYWPSLSQFVEAIASDAQHTIMEADDPLTAAATAATRPSRADFFKALFAAIEENSAENYGPLPTGFRLTDNTFASLANCVLALGPDDPVDSAYVKRLRQRERSAEK